MKNEINIKKIKTILLLSIFLQSIISSSFAFMEDYPPFSKGKGMPKSLSIQGLPTEFQDGNLSVKTYDAYPNSVRPSVTDVYYKGKQIWSSNDEAEGSYRTYYEGLCDLNGDGVKDVIIVSGPAAPNSLAVYIDFITIFLRNKEKAPDILQYKTMSFDAKQDILDFKGDGNAGFLKCDLVQDVETLDKRTHSFWLYTIYELKGSQLVMNNSLWKRFPKFIQYTNKENSRPTNKISKDIQNQYIATKVPQTINPSQPKNLGEKKSG